MADLPYFMNGHEGVHEEFQAEKRLAKLMRPEKRLHPFLLGVKKKALKDLSETESDRNRAVYTAAAWLARHVPNGYLSESDVREWVSGVAIDIDAPDWQRALDNGIAAGIAEPLDLTEQLDNKPQSHYDKLLGSLYSVAGLDDIPPPKPLVEDTLFFGSVAFLIGPPANGKSFVAIDLACRVATGYDWFGRKVKPGTVLYGAFEGVSGIRARFKGWLHHNGVETIDRARVLTMPSSMTDSDEWGAFVKLAKEMKADLVVLDTLSWVFGADDENNNRLMHNACQRAQDIADATGACVLVVHHTRKGVEDTVRLEDMRGGSAAAGAVTTVIGCLKPPGDPTITINCVKQKDVEYFDDFAVQLVEAPDRYFKALTEVDASTTGAGTADDLLDLWWEQIGSELVTAKQLVDLGILPTTADFLRAKGGLDASGRLVTVPCGRYDKYYLTSPEGD